MVETTINLGNCSLILVNMGDDAFVHDLFKASDVKKFYVIPDRFSYDLSSFTRYMVDSISRGAGLDYIIRNNYGTKVGLISGELVRFNGEVMWNIGYAVHSSYRRQGFASSALAGFANYLLSNFSIPIVSLDISTENRESELVAQKCGFKKPSGGPNVAYIDEEHPDLGFRFKWFKQLEGKRIDKFNMAMQCVRMKDYRNAIVYYKQALDEPYVPNTPYTDAQIYSNLGMSYSSIREYQMAFSCLMKAKSLGLDNPSIEKELLWLRNNAGIY